MQKSVATGQRELEDLETIKLIASALFDISAEKTNRLRNAFQKNMAFYEEISSLYRSIKATARSRGELPELAPTVVHSVSIAFTSNARFYGAVNSRVMRAFVKTMREDDKRDYIVIGRTGHAFLENYPKLAKRVSYFSFESDEPTLEEMRRLLADVSAYNEVDVFYPSFVNVFTQEVAVLDIAYSPDAESIGGKVESIDYIFEPELPKILTFFETRVRHLLFRRAMLESELARTASRLFSMNRAQDRADVSITRARRSLERSIRTFNDARLLESFSAISKWKK